MNLQPIHAEFSEIESLWKNKLWPGRTSPIRSHSSMKLGGGFNLDVYSEPAYFWKILDPNGNIIGVNSGFCSDLDHFRSRGLYVDPAWQGKGLAKKLLVATEEEARRQGHKILWSFARESALPAYKSVGFEVVRGDQDKLGEFGPNFYVVKELS